MSGMVEDKFWAFVMRDFSKRLNEADIQVPAAICYALEKASDKVADEFLDALQGNLRINMKTYNNDPDREEFYGMIAELLTRMKQEGRPISDELLS